MKVEQLNVYPIKSCGGFALESSQLNVQGLQHDRNWMIVNADNVFISQRKFPRMSQIKVTIAGSEIRLNFAGHGEIASPLEFTGKRVTAQVWRDEVGSVCHDDAINQWLSEVLQENVRLVRMATSTSRMRSKNTHPEPFATSFADSAPVLVVNRASLRAVEGELGRVIGIERFRGNIVVDTQTPFDEEEWSSLQSSEISTPQAFSLGSCYPCERCEIINIDPNTGDADPQVMRALLRVRKKLGLAPTALFGRRSIPMFPAVISVGAQVAFS